MYIIYTDPLFQVAITIVQSVSIIKSEIIKKKGEQLELVGSVSSNVKSSISTAFDTHIGKLKDDIITEIGNRLDSVVKQQLNAAISRFVVNLSILDERMFKYNYYSATDGRAKKLKEIRDKLGGIQAMDSNETFQVEIKSIPSHCIKVADTEFNYFSSSGILECIRSDNNFSLSSDMLIKTIETILLMAYLVEKPSRTFVIPKLVEVRSDDESTENLISGDILKNFIDPRGVGKFLFIFFIAKIDDRFVMVIASTAENSTLQIECLEKSSQELNDQQISVLRDCVYIVLGRENRNSNEVSLTFQRKTTFPILKPGKADKKTSVLGIESMFDERDDKNLDYFATKAFDSKYESSILVLFPVFFVVLKLIYIDSESSRKGLKILSEVDGRCHQISEALENYSVDGIALLFRVLDEFVLSVLNCELGEINSTVSDDSLKELVSFIDKSKSEIGESCHVIQH